MTRTATSRLYFISIICPPSIDEQVMVHKQWMHRHFGCRVAMRSPGHITLIPPFWLEESRQEELELRFHAFRSQQNELQISMNGFAHFGDRVLYIKVEENPGLGALRNNAELHFKNAFPEVIKPDSRPFQPHVTIATRDVLPGTFVKAWAHFSNAPFTAGFQTKIISLLKLVDGKWTTIATQDWCENR
jgi:2'-5' RNA ligase